MKDIFYFLNKFNLVNWHDLNGNRLILVGESKEINKDNKINKPSQLGGFILLRAVEKFVEQRIKN